LICVALATQGGFAAPAKPTPLPFMAGEPTENPTLSTKKKNTAREIQK
jgi:hypothetical protein